MTAKRMGASRQVSILHRNGLMDGLEGLGTLLEGFPASTPQLPFEIPKSHQVEAIRAVHRGFIEAHSFGAEVAALSMSEL